MSSAPQAASSINIYQENHRHNTKLVSEREWDVVWGGKGNMPANLYNQGLPAAEVVARALFCSSMNLFKNVLSMNTRARETHPLRLFTRGREKKMHMHTHKGSTAAAKVNSFLTFMKIFTEHFSAICLNFAVWSKHLSQRRLYVLGTILHQGLGVTLGSKTHIPTTSPSTRGPLTLAPDSVSLQI